MEINLRIDEVLHATREASADGLYLAAEHVLGVSTAHVPIEMGDLQASGQASEDRANLTAAVSYDTPYAVRQHEEMGYRHKAGRAAKYLENAVNSEAGKAAEIIAQTIRSRTGG